VLQKHHGRRIISLSRDPRASLRKKAASKAVAKRGAGGHGKYYGKSFAILKQTCDNLGALLVSLVGTGLDIRVIPNLKSETLPQWVTISSISHNKLD